MFLCCREWSIEKAMDKMTGDWDGMTFELGSWKETGAHATKQVVNKPHSLLHLSLEGMDVVKRCDVYTFLFF